MRIDWSKSSLFIQGWDNDRLGAGLTAAEEFRMMPEQMCCYPEM